VREQVEDGHPISAHAERQNMYPSWLTVEYASTRLISFCNQRDGGGKNRREGADPATHMPATVSTRTARDRATMYTARRHHGGRVDQRRDRRGTFHGVRQPDIQRNLRRFSGGAEEHQQGHPPSARRNLLPPGIAPLRSAGIDVGEPHVPNTDSISSMPSTKPASPTRLTMNAFLPASAADFLWK